MALERLFAIAAEAKVDKVWTDAMNPRPRVWPSVQKLLADRRPDLLDHYRQVLFSKTFRPKYQAELARRIRRAASKAKVRDRLA